MLHHKRNMAVYFPLNRIFFDDDRIFFDFYRIFSIDDRIAFDGTVYFQRPYILLYETVDFTKSSFENDHYGAKKRYSYANFHLRHNNQFEKIITNYHKLS